MIHLICSETKEIIENYVEAYNSEANGIQAFRELAEKSAMTFSIRRQNIMEYRVIDDKIEVLIDYEGILAVDLPNGLKKGNKVQLKGKSVFQFEEGKISQIEDYS